MSKGYGVICITNSGEKMGEVMDFVKEHNYIAVYPMSFTIAMVVFDNGIEANVFLEKAKDICIVGHKVIKDIEYSEQDILMPDPLS